MPDDAPVMMIQEKLLKKSLTAVAVGMVGDSLVPYQNNIKPMSNVPLVVTGVHLDLTEALKAIVSEKVSKLFRHNARIVRAHVELVHGRSRDHSREFAAQIRLELPGPDIVVREESNDLYKSIDLLIDKVDRQLRRRHRLDKEKRNHPHPTDLGKLGRAA